MSIKSTQFSDAIKEMTMRTTDASNMYYLMRRITDINETRLTIRRRIFLIYIFLCIIDEKRLCVDSFLHVNCNYKRNDISNYLRYFTTRYKVLYRVSIGLYNYNTYAEHIYENFYKALRDKYSHIADCLPERLPPPPVYL